MFTHPFICFFNYSKTLALQSYQCPLLWMIVTEAIYGVHLLNGGSKEKNFKRRFRYSDTHSLQALRHTKYKYSTVQYTYSQYSIRNVSFLPATPKIVASETDTQPKKGFEPGCISILPNLVVWDWDTQKMCTNR